MTRNVVLDEEKKLQITMLQGPRLLTGFHAFDECFAHRIRARELIALLIARSKPVKKADIAASLFEVKVTKKEINRALVMVCRIRKDVEAIGAGLPLCILNDNHGSYQWNMDTVAGSDIIVMRRLCRQIRSAGKMVDICWARVEKLQKIYRQAPFEEFANKKWTQPFRKKAQMLYHDTITHALALLWQEEAYERILQVCRQGLIVMPGIESWEQDLEKAKTITASLAGS